MLNARRPFRQLAGSAPPQGAFPGGAPGAPTADGTAARPGGESGPGEGSSTDSAVTALLQASNTRCSAATVGAQSAASLELADGTPVIAIGGFTGSDPAPTLAQFQTYVAAGEVHYFIAGGNGGGPGDGGGGGSEIAGWVAAHYTATTVGGSTVYGLTQAATG